MWKDIKDIIIALTPVILGYLAYKTNKLHKQVNGRMGEMLNDREEMGRLKEKTEAITPPGMAVDTFKSPRKL